jgi:membrane protein
VAIAVIAVLPALLDGLGLGRVGEVLILVLRWPLLAALIAVALAVVYRYAPDRDEPRWAWVSAGAALATVLWVVGSIAFSIYVNNFGSYNETYGAIGAVIILLLWLFLSSFVVLVGAEVNAETEHQTAQDTTKGPREPLGQRDAYAADTIGEAKD